MSIETLYEQEGERLTRRLARMVGSRALAEDLGQEAYIRTWRGAPAHLRGGERAAWLNRVATNLAIDELRRRRRGPQFDLDAIEPSANDHGHDPDEVVAVREALQALTAHDRMVLLVRFELGLSHAEIGALLAMAPDGARKRVERARKRFAEVLRTGRRARGPLRPSWSVSTSSTGKGSKRPVRACAGSSTQRRHRDARASAREC